MKDTGEYIDKIQEEEMQEENLFSVLHINQKRNYGRYIVLLRNKKGVPILALGPHWFIFVGALIAISGMFIWIYSEIQAKISHTKQIALKMSTLVFIFSYLLVGFINPGFVERTRPALKRSNTSFCDICQVVQKREDWHCHQCQVCIQQYDHHCPWIGKCVGKNNLKAFYFFIIMIFGTLFLHFYIASTIPNKSGSIQK